jgi:uncharacterized integral membrane protein (TIGR00698 family)
LGLALLAQGTSAWLGAEVLGLPKSPVSPIMLAILLGLLLANLLHLPALFQPGIRFSLVRVLRLGIVLLGLRLSLDEAGEIGLKALPVIVVCVLTALWLVTFISKRLGLSPRLGTLIAAGTGICGATAIVALSPSIQAKENETAYAVACIALFGMLAMLAYPFAAHWLFAGEAFRAGLFLGTSVHDTAQVAGAGLVYQQQFGSQQALDVAIVTKLVRNLGMLVVIPLLSVLYHRSHQQGGETPSLWSMVPLFVLVFAGMSLLRTLGDLSTPAFGFLAADTWQALIAGAASVSELALGVAMAAVGLGTRLDGLKAMGFKPLLVGLVSALLVGLLSYLLIISLY